MRGRVIHCAWKLSKPTRMDILLPNDQLVARRVERLGQGAADPVYFGAAGVVCRIGLGPGVSTNLSINRNRPPGTALQRLLDCQDSKLMPASKASQYTVAKALHWFAAVLIGFSLLAGWRLATFELDTRRVLLMVHSGVGVTILALMLVRWWWRRKNNLYAPPNWWRQPIQLSRWVFYPLLVLQPVLGLLVAMFNDYDVYAFGVVNVSALADSNEALRSLFHQAHTWLAYLLIALVVAHSIERLRKLYT